MDKVPFFWLIQVGFFLVLFPASISARWGAEQPKHQFNKSFSIAGFFGMNRAEFDGSPKWLRMAVIAGFWYAGINFLLFGLSYEGTPDIQEGQYVLHEHGRLIKVLTEVEYNYHKSVEGRGATGHAIAFYGLTVAMLYKFSGLGKNIESA